MFLNQNQITSIATLHNCTPAGKYDREITPILTAISVTVEGSKLTATATDRYIAGEVGFELDDFYAAEPFTIQLSSTDWQTVAKLKSSADITVEDATVTVRAGHTEMRLIQVGGSFPPVARLFPEEHETEGLPVVSLNLDFLTRIAKLRTPFGIGEGARCKGQPWRFQAKPTDSGKPGPVLLTQGKRAAGADSMRVLIQPDLLLD